METLFRDSNRRLANTSMKLTRYLLTEIDWSNRFITITGSRGVGKTTLIYQHMKETFTSDDKALYVSMENPYFYNHSIVDLIEDFHNNGGRHIFLDEVHKYKNWSRELKFVYDSFSDLHIVITASSILDIYKAEADLSRRAISYSLEELSLREYIEFNSGKKLHSFSFKEIIKDHVKIAETLLRDIKPILEFNNYLKHGCYPFFKEGKGVYSEKVLNAINLIIEVDLIGIKGFDYSLVPKLKKFQYLISTSLPFTPNITKLSERLGVSRPTLLKAIQHLQEAQLVIALHKEARGIGILTKPEKLFVRNTNLMYAYGGDKVDVGARRETFFVNQVSMNNELTLANRADFIVDGKYTFEVGGKNKDSSQIRGVKNSFLVKDNIEVGFGNVIPLWLFGFMY
ncbi:MAG: ATP-binding protein [Flavobacteriales bacterium]|nr:ATP-binding protein [Flavobacteriales bacterium]